MDLVKRHFRPEFLNRLDDIIIFDPLTEKDLIAIARIYAHSLNQRLKRNRITLLITD